MLSHGVGQSLNHHLASMAAHPETVEAVIPYKTWRYPVSIRACVFMLCKPQDLRPPLGPVTVCFSTSKGPSSAVVAQTRARIPAPIRRLAARRAQRGHPGGVSNAGEGFIKTRWELVL